MKLGAENISNRLNSFMLATLGFGTRRTVSVHAMCCSYKPEFIFTWLSLHVKGEMLQIIVRNQL